MKKINVMTILVVLTAFICSIPVFSSVSDLQNQLANKKIDGVAASASTGTVYRTGGVGLNFRTGPWGSIQGLLNDGDKLTVIGKEGDWYKVKSGNKTGYVHGHYLNVSGGDNGDHNLQTVAGTKYVSVGSSYLNVRTGPWGTKIGRLRTGDKVQIMEKTGDWVKIKYNGKTAFVHGDYLTKTKPASGSNNTGSNTGTASGNVGKGWGGTPCAGRISSNYGWRTHPITGGRKFHHGIDIAAGAGTPCKSLGPGKVIYAGWSDGYGNLVKVQHDNGYVSYYGHLKSFNVRSGQRVGQNQVVAAVNTTGSSTGNHLHFELRKNGNSVNPRSVAGVKF